ncbi:autotransporter-associated N-terminal domain-containing protein, partial [Fusobacterium sp. PH5-44]|uniref:autotransporter-associated N-terminal domain-containing protein n=1 Tax=unclassified Fusobacterium TaxID=2648384 RepID=UPI003D19C509
MKKNMKELAEKSLKSFLKRKKIGYTASLLIAFLITGGIGLGSSTLSLQAAQSQEELLANIEAQKSEIILLLEENEKRLKELKGDQYELIRKGNFYSKPIYESEMILFPIVVEHSGKMKDKTRSEFKISYDATNRYYSSQGYNMNANGEEAGKKPLVGLTSEEAKGLTYEQQIALLIEKNNGVLAKVNTPDAITVDLGANIQLITPQIPQLSVSPQVESPSVNMPQLTTPQIVQVTPPSTPSSPVVSTVSVSTPATVDRISIDEPQLVDPILAEPKEITISNPATPAIFDPLMIIPPEAPSIPVVNIPTLPTIEINVVSNGNGYAVYVDNPNGGNSVISHVGVLGGDFKIFRNEGGSSTSYTDNYWQYSYDNYDVINIGNSAATGDVTLAAPALSGGTYSYSTLHGLTTSGTTKTSSTNQRGFMRQLQNSPTYNNGNFVVTRASENQSIVTDEFIHMDIHGGSTKENVIDRLTAASSFVNKDQETIKAFNDILDNLDRYNGHNNYSVFSNSGNITLEGGNLSLNNMYTHSGNGKNIIMNTGNITVQPYFNGVNQYGGINGVFVISQDTSDVMHNLMYNGETGNIDIYTKNSVGYIVSSGNTLYTKHVYKYDYSNHTWSSWELDPMNGGSYYEIYDTSNSRTHYNSYDDIKNMYSPYATVWNSNSSQVHSTVNRGKLNIYGAGSAGVYLKNLGESDSQKNYIKDDRGGVTQTLYLVGVDCSVNGGIADFSTYPEYGFPIINPLQAVSIYHPADGWPVNNTDIEFNGGDNKADIQFVKEDGTPAPITMYGDQSVGLYIPGASIATTVHVSEYDMEYGGGGVVDTFVINNNDIGLVTGNVYIDLGDINGNGNITYTSDPNSTSGIQITNDSLGNTNLTTIDGAAAILSGADLDLTSHGIRIFDGNKGSLGVGIISGATHNLGTGYINVLGGQDNVGVLIDDGTLISNGEINLLGGTGSVGILQSSGKAAEAQVNKINVGNTDMSTAGAVGVFAINSGTELTTSGRINVNGDNYGAYATNSGKIILTKDILTGTKDNPDMYVKGTTSASGQPTGVGLIVSRGTSGGIIEARNYYLKTEANSAGVASTGTGSLIDMQGSVIDYAGKGYAVYSDGVGQVDLKNGGEIKLRSGTALELNLSLGTSPVSFDSSSKITMLSNDAVGVNLTNLPGSGLFTSALDSTVRGYLGNVNIVAGTENGVTYDKYKIAAVDGGMLTIDSVLDKSDNNPSSDSYFFYRRFLGQRMNVVAQKNVSAVIDSQTATDYYRGTVVGLEMSSSPLATAITDTSIRINNGVTLTADRIDAGTGAIGLYINYGYVNNDGSIMVETGNNAVNNGAIGMYGVNGAILRNRGYLEVSGKNSVGIYGISYRVDSNGVIVPMEFGSSLTTQGQTVSENDGDIVMNGDESVGMYSLNNSLDPSLPIGTPSQTLFMQNNSIIDISNTKNSIGMYGVGDVQIYNFGTIKVGEEGIGIYAGDGTLIGSTFGNITLGKDAIGVVLEGSVHISLVTSYAPTGSYITGEKGKIGLVLKSATDGVIDTTPKMLNLNINASGLDHGTALYINDRANIISAGNIDVGNAGVGIYLNNGNASNIGTISLGTSASAIGMYATKGKLTNDGIISINKDGQIGMVAYGATGEVENTGTINLNADNSAAIYLKDGATFSLGGSGVTNFVGTKNFGVFADKGIVNIGTSVNINLPNADENIYVYGKDGSKINHTSGTFAINGGGASGNKKTVGIYLNNNTNTANEYLSTAGTMTVTGGALGLYSKNSNNITLNQIDVTGNKSVGIYMENGGKLSGKVTSSGATATESVVGVYGNGGIININNPLTLEMGTGNTYGLGMYLENGVSVEGQGIAIENKSTANTNVGLYYTGNNTSVHKTDITLLGNKVVGFYADNNINLSSNKDITFTTGATEQVGAYVLGDATFTNSGDLDVLSNNSTAVYVGDGIGVNTGTIEIQGNNSVGLIAQGKATGDTAKVINQGVMDITNGVGMLLGDTSGPGVLGTSIGENKGTITAGAGTVG